MFNVGNKYNNLFKKDFEVQEIIGIEGICYESMPCQHKVKYKSNGKYVERLMRGNIIWQILSDLNFPIVKNIDSWL